MRITWTVYQSGGKSVEAQCWAPDEGSRRAILFCPGFPGMGAGLFEQRHAAVLAGAGYELIVLRHNGTRLGGPHAPLMVNNAARLMQARTEGVPYLGGGPSTIEGWLEEPLTALQAIHNDYDEITVIGNSFGALSALWSLTAAGAPFAKIRHLLLLAGAQGIHTGSGGPDDVMRIWLPAFVAMPRITEKIAIGSPVDTCNAIRATYLALPERARALPAAMALTYLVVMKDELLALSDTEQFRAALGGRGTVVRDEIDRPYPDHGFLAHDMPDYPSEMLLNLLKE